MFTLIRYIKYVKTYQVLVSQCAYSTNDLVCYVGLKMTD